MVLNVGMSYGRPLDKLTADSWDEEFSVNLRSHMLFSQAALPVMEIGASIVLISSLAALRNQSRNPAYEASKAGQVSLARSVAVAGESKAIRCNAVLPGLIDTPMGRDATRRRPNRAVAVPFGRRARPGKWPTPASTCCRTNPATSMPTRCWSTAGSASASGATPPPRPDSGQQAAPFVLSPT